MPLFLNTPSSGVEKPFEVVPLLVKIAPLLLVNVPKLPRLELLLKILLFIRLEEVLELAIEYSLLRVPLLMSVPGINVVKERVTVSPKGIVRVRKRISYRMKVK
jgi:hypothetical protein